MDGIVWLDEIGLEDRSRVGGKAAALGTLYRAGIPVPAGFCIPVQDSPELNDELWREIEAAYRQLASGGSAVAVRSSGVEEDSARASYAGQYETVLNVHDSGDLRTAVNRCWQSALSERVLAYQSTHTTQTGGGRLPLLIQKQIAAITSGVLFTLDPVTGSDAAMLIEGTAGLGEGLVSGHVSPARYRVDRRQQVEIVQDDHPEPLLTGEQCRVLAVLGGRIEELLGKGQDIEWAVDSNGVHVLQARPITGRWTSWPLSMVWTRANIGEVLPNVITPLTWGVFRATLLNDPGLALGAPSRQNGLEESIRQIHGRGYVRLDGLLHSFCYLPAVTPSVMRQVLGVDLPAVAESYQAPRGMMVWLAQAAFLADALRILPRLRWLARRLPEVPTHGLPTALSFSERLSQAITWTAQCFRLHIKCTAYAVGAFGLLSSTLKRWLPSQAETFLPQVLIGHEELQTAAQGLTLWQLADQVRENESLLEAIATSAGWAELATTLPMLSGGPEFLEAMDLFMQHNGARTAGEFELAVPRWSEEPSFVLDVLRQLLRGKSSGLMAADPMEHRRRRVAATAQLGASLNTYQRWILARLLSSFSDYVTWRENIKYRLMEGYALLRHTFCAIAGHLVASGVLEATGDIFFLTPPEVIALLTGRGSELDVPGLILGRREQHAQWNAQDAPGLVIGEAGAPTVAARASELTGIGCSPGAVEGIARVLADSSQASQLQPGEILVAPHTDPGWTPLFLTCSAVVTEIGGFLSHGATVAREYGIPAVMNVIGATTRIHTGDRIRVDGSSGRIVLVDPAKVSQAQSDVGSISHA